MPLLALALAGGALAGCGGDKKKASAAQPTTTASGPCKKVAAPTPKADGSLAKPKLKLDPSKTWTATLTTNCGSFTITLDVKRAPKTAASFASLVKKGFYDDLTFHRIAPGFVIQGGDPLGAGTGGSGYTIVEAPPKNLQYVHGIVAMAKTGTEPDGASGSQFFIVLGEDAGLPPQYALVGKVTSGLDVVDAIGAVKLQSADPQGSAPVDPVVIQSATVNGS